MRELSVGMEPRVVVIGSSPLFHSGISVYTWRLAHALHERYPTSVLLLRKLIPARLYPGVARVGKNQTRIDYTGITQLGNVDWYWGLGLPKALRALAGRRPDVLVLQWWTVATFHTYVAICLWARARGIRVVIEFHEVQDPGEAKIRVVKAAASRILPALVKLADGVVVHNSHDLASLRELVDFGDTPIATIPHGPYDHLHDGGPADREPGRPATVLFFGGIRSHKGVDDLIEAFSALPRETAEKLRLTIVGEVWEGWDRPQTLARTSPHADLIHFEGRYVDDDEIPALFADADALAVPYKRGTSSGPLSIGVSAGVPVLMYDVPALREFVAGYEGATLLPIGDVPALTQALAKVAEEPGRRFEPPAEYSWAATARRFGELFETVLARRPRRRRR